MTQYFNAAAEVSDKPMSAVTDLKEGESVTVVVGSDAIENIKGIHETLEKAGINVVVQEDEYGPDPQADFDDREQEDTQDGGSYGVDEAKRYGNNRKHDTKAHAKIRKQMAKKSKRRNRK